MTCLCTRKVREVNSGARKHSLKYHFNRYLWRIFAAVIKAQFLHARPDHCRGNLNLGFCRPVTHFAYYSERIANSSITLPIFSLGPPNVAGDREFSRLQPITMKGKAPG